MGNKFDMNVSAKNLSYRKNRYGHKRVQSLDGDLYSNVRSEDMSGSAHIRFNRFTQTTVATRNGKVTTINGSISFSVTVNE